MHEIHEGTKRRYSTVSLCDAFILCIRFSFIYVNLSESAKLYITLHEVPLRLVVSHIYFVKVQISHRHFRLPSADLLCSNMTPKPQLLGVCVQPQLRHRADSWAPCTGRQVDLYVLQVRGLSTIRCFLQTTAVFFGDTMDDNCKDHA